MGVLWPSSNQMEFDNNGDRAPGAKAYFYEASTTTPKAVYRDASESTVFTQPVTADGNGRWPAVFVPFGSYKVVTATSAGAAIGNTIDNIPNEAPTNPEDTVDPEALFTTGLVVFDFKDGTRDGFVRCNGRSIGSAASTATERANADCEDLFTYLWNNLLDTTCPVSGGRGASAAADWAANKNIGVPSLRGVLPAGLATMGNTDSGNYTDVPVVLGSATIAGSVLGSNTHALSTAELATHLHTVSLTSGVESVDHHHSVSLATDSQGAHTHTGTTDSSGAHTHNYDKVNTQTVFAAGGSGGAITTFASTATSSDGAHTHPFTTGSSGTHTHTVSGITSGVSVNHTHSVSGNTGNNGSGTAHNNTSRMILGTYYIKL